jgi:hypothetical protein
MSKAEAMKAAKQTGNANLHLIVERNWTGLKRLTSSQIQDFIDEQCGFAARAMYSCTCPLCVEEAA